MASKLARMPSWMSHSRIQMDAVRMIVDLVVSANDVAGQFQVDEF